MIRPYHMVIRNIKGGSQLFAYFKEDSQKAQVFI